MIEQLRNNFNFVMTIHFEGFEKTMKERSRILVFIVKQHAKDVCFLVDTNFTHVQETFTKSKMVETIAI